MLIHNDSIIVEKLNNSGYVAIDGDRVIILNQTAYEIYKHCNLVDRSQAIDNYIAVNFDQLNNDEKIDIMNEITDTIDRLFELKLILDCNN